MVSGRIATLDGLRGWAALAVVFYHTLLEADPRIGLVTLHGALQEQPGTMRVLLKLALALSSGELAVGVFFVLSGLVLMRSLQRLDRDAGCAIGVTARWFLIRRTLRIWPAMAVCVVAQFALFRAVGAAWPGHVAPLLPGDLLANLLLTRFPVNGATWTLLVEMAAVPLLLLCFYGTRRFGRWFVAALGGYALVAVKFKFLVGGSPELATGFPFLLAGVAIGEGWYAPLLQPRYRSAAGWGALALLGGGLLLAPSTWLVLRALALLAAIPVLVALVGTMQAGRVVRLLEAPLSQALGVLSFSLYLWNVPVFELMMAALGPAVTEAAPLLAGLGVGAAAALVTLPLAAASERWIEQPCIRLGRLLTRAAPVTRVAATRR